MTAPRRIAPAFLVLLLCAALAPAAAEAKTNWLCFPAQLQDPCSPGLDTTRFSPSGERIGVDRVRRARPRRIDCFYVYPTVSGQPTPLADLAIGPEIRSIALYQASRYSRDCRVYAPVYRQVTLAGLFSGAVTSDMRETPYADVLSAWRDYLRNYNRGRGFVLISHSQGTFYLRRLVAEEIEPRRSVRRRMVSALLLGGGVTVAEGKDTGGDFERLRACRSARQLRCIVAFSVFDEPVPEAALFGRTRAAGREVLCTNPAALGGGTARVTPMIPREPFAPDTAIGIASEAVGIIRPPASTDWLSFPRAYEARCSKARGASVLQVRARGGAPDLKPSPNAGWGLHTADGNIALGDLARLVRKQAARYVRRTR